MRIISYKKRSGSLFCKRSQNGRSYNKGFSLAEVLAALTIGAMILVAVLGVYSQAENSVAAVTRKLDSVRVPGEVLQRIAEDLDRTVSTGSDTRIKVENKFEDGYPKARLTITRTLNANSGKPETFEEIVWQAGYDFDSEVEGLVLYRSHRGIAIEDKLLEGDTQKGQVERELFVPMCEGVTYFKAEVPQGDRFLDQWAGTSLPKGIRVTISFAEPFKTVKGTLDVPEDEKTTRMIAVDKTRKIIFQFIPSKDVVEISDVNEQGKSEQLR